MNALKHLYIRFHRPSRGQTMTEYVMIVSAIAIIVFVGYQTFGSSLGSDVTAINTAL